MKVGRVLDSPTANELRLASRLSVVIDARKAPVTTVVDTIACLDTDENQMIAWLEAGKLHV